MKKLLLICSLLIASCSPGYRFAQVGPNDFIVTVRNDKDRTIVMQKAMQDTFLYCRSYKWTGSRVIRQGIDETRTYEVVEIECY